MNQKLYHIPQGNSETSATLKDEKETGVVFQQHLPFCTIWPVQKTDGLWGRTVDYRKLNQAVTPNAATKPDVV